MVRVYFLSRTQTDLRDKQTLLLGRLHNGLYKISSLGNSSPTALTVINRPSPPWHSRLGHPGHDTLIKLAGQIKDLVPVNKSISCASCNKAKSHKISFNKSTTVSSKPFDLIHTDVWGPTAFPSTDGYRYYIIFIDDHTRFTWIYFLHAKHQVLATFRHFCKMVHTQFHTTPKILRSDDGGEYTSHAFKTFLQDHGILQQLSCPYTPEQNGLSERKHRHLLDITRAIMLESGTPNKFWMEAISTANYLINFLPSKAVSGSIPFKLLHGRDPHFHLLRTFGCLCYPWLRPYIFDKFSPRSQACVFVGYSPIHKGYKCYDLSTGKTHISRHVVFYEHQFPYKSITTSDRTSTPLPDSHIPPTLLIPTSAQPIHTTPQSVTTSPPSNSVNNIISSPDPISSASHPASQTVLLPSVSIQHGPPTHPMQTRSKSGIHKPKQILNLLAHSNNSITPATYNQAAKSSHWQQAMLTEFNGLKQQATWTLVQPPVNKPVLGCKWTYKIKLLPNGNIDRYKARLVALGYNQQFGINYNETFSPVAKMTTICLLLALAVNRNWPIHQLDIANAFLHGDLPEDIYMRQPPGFVDQQNPTAVCKLHKSLYGLKQAPRQWFQKLTSFLQSKGFTISRADPSLLILDSNSSLIFILIYVDDFLVTGNDPTTIQILLQQLRSQFALKQLGNISLFLGIQVLQSTNGYFLSQQHYATKLLIDAGFENSKSAPTPIAPSPTKLGQTTQPFPDPTLYRRLAGSLQYLTITRPDIAFATNRVCHHMQNPTEQNYKDLKRILRYINGTLSHGLPISPGSLELHSYSDADWASDSSDRKSISGFCTFLGPNLISWTVKKQATVAKSSTEAEYRSLSAANSEVVWLRRLAAELHLPQPNPTTIHCDNTSAIAIAKNPVFHARTKHIEIDYHFIRQQISAGDIKLVHISSKDQVADIFTKPFSITRFNELRTKLTIRPTNA
ncbi:Retrovirus-related Pol polyprotein from transposon TNT 1-94 [Dendrobium catenatum]|uniref:Retrovirus-related Pol polyprotein from transposon TNT 1-94 n=1 Tax=Dendrobium catenatum TaxID=906689 RepID=A0A2I0V6Q6_9ASPA|nr:Retrovirus-related Pol polyprotein from transposon TNT 1-94 [Dendrobium catenatum]